MWQEAAIIAMQLFLTVLAVTLVLIAAFAVLNHWQWVTTIIYDVFSLAFVLLLLFFSAKQLRVASQRY